MNFNYILILALFLISNLSFSANNLEKATFAGGCFWCMEAPFERYDGIIEAISGYTGGHKKNPIYEEVSSGITGHYEAIEITYDSAKITYEEILDIFWKQIDPTDADGQFVDRGQQYSTAIFYHSEKQKNLAKKSIKNLEDAKIYDKKIVTPLIKASIFYPAEDYHQDYYKKNTKKYKFYRFFSGRDQFLNKYWKKSVK